MRRIFYMVFKEFRQVFRDPQMVGLIFVVPIFQLLVLSFAITTEVKHLKLLVVDLDGSRTSREVVRSFSHTDRFNVVGFTRDLREIQPAMQGWQAQVALVIPPGFGRDLQRGLSPQVQVVVDGVDGNTASVATGYARGILGQFAQGAVRTSRVQGAIMEERMWYNPDLSSKQFMVPGIVVVLLTILPMTLSSLSLVKEKEIGTLEQLMVTPLSKYQLLLGKLVPFLVLSYVELALVTAVAVLVFDISMNGSYGLLAALAFLYLFSTLGLGIFVSTITQSQQQAMFVSWFFMVFMVLMSGFFIPIENMPPVLQKVTYLNPMRFFTTITREIFQKGSSLRYLMKDVIPMTGFGLLIVGLSVVKFRKRIG